MCRQLLLDLLPPPPYVCRCVSTELTGSILTCRHDFSPEWRSYYDHRYMQQQSSVSVAYDSILLTRKSANCGVREAM